MRPRVKEGTGAESDDPGLVVPSSIEVPESVRVSE